MAGKHPIALLTFDVDDTLYSSTEFARLARENSLKAMIQAGLKADLKTALAELHEVVDEFTSNDERHFDRMLQRLGPKCLDGINPSILIATGIAAYHDTVHDSLMAYEDAEEAFKRLHSQGYRLGIISQGYTIKQAQKLVRLRVLPYVAKDAIFFSDQMGLSKSNPKFYQHAAERLKLAPQNCMHVGDRPDRDIDPANKAGWLTVLNRRTGRYHERPGITPPAHTVHNFWDLLEVIEKQYQPA